MKIAESKNAPCCENWRRLEHFVFRNFSSPILLKDWFRAEIYDSGEPPDLNTYDRTGFAGFLCADLFAEPCPGVEKRRGFMTACQAFGPRLDNLRRSRQGGYVGDRLQFIHVGTICDKQ